MLAPPTIVEELSVCSTQIRLRNQLRSAKVEVFIEGTPTPIVDAVSDWPDQWFAFRPGVVLVAGQTVRARQTLSGDVSELSTDGAIVQDRATVQPYFVAPLVGCSRIAVVEGFTPGATVTISDNNGSLGSAVSAGSRIVVGLSRNVNNGEMLSATAAACGASPGGAVQSLPAEPMRSGDPRLATPKLEPVWECQRVLMFSNVRVGAILKLKRDDGTNIQWTCSAPELHGRIDPPLKKNETLKFWQEPPSRQCEVSASAPDTAIVAGGPPGPPQIVTRPCPGSKWLEVRGLVPSATVKVLADGTEVCIFEAAETSEAVDLGKAVLTAGQRLTVVQGLCGVFSVPSPVPSWVTVAPLASHPAIPEHLYSCAGVVRVAGIAGASRVTLFSDKLKGRIGHALTEDDSVDIAVSPPLVVGDRIYATIAGCAAGSAAREVEPMRDMPPIGVVQPRAGDRSVVVRNLLPGSHIDVDVDGHWAGGCVAGGTEARVGVTDALVENQSVKVSARMCSQVRSAAPVLVLAALEISWSRPTVRALEMRTGHLMSGRVNAAILLGGGRALLGTEEGGLWIVATPGGMAIPLSLDWPTPLIRSLVRGPRGNDHVYCGTTNGIQETDTSKPVPLLSWTSVNGLPMAGGPGGLVYDLLVLNGRLYAATNVGLWWSTIPASAGAGYAWASDPLVSQIDVRAVCEGPSGSVVAYGLNAGAGIFVRGVWSGGTVTWSNVTPGVAGAVSDSRLTTVVTQMRNGHVASCATDRFRICAALEDGNDNAWLAVLRSDDGGVTWTIPYADPTLVRFKPGGTVDLGFQADRNLRVAFHPQNRDKILLAARRTGLLGSTDAGVNWDATTWPNISDGSFHADCLCMAFDGTDPTGNTLLVGSDGGAFLSTDFGKSWDSSYNRTLTTLMFDQQTWSAAPALSASDAFPGLIVGAFQDNGKGYLNADGEPWRELGSVGDGQRALFVTGDIVLNGGNDDVDLKWARWDGAAFVDEVTFEPPGYPAATTFMPFMARVSYPGRTDSATGAMMIAVAGDNQPSGNVWGLFDRGAGHTPRAERLYWLLLGTVPFPIAAVASLTGRVVVVGATQAGPPAAAHIYLLDSLTSTVTETTLPAGMSNSPRWLTLCGGTLAFALSGNTLLRTTDLATWQSVPVALGGGLNVLAVDRAEDPVRLLMGGSDGVWSSRNYGATWIPTKGQPRHPQANHLEVVEYASGQRVAHLGTWNWSVWRAQLS